ncbi:MAG: EamA family transporter [Anaerolineales bacterium]|nr:EamA family transporter [Anaerolineales bacterium]
MMDDNRETATSLTKGYGIALVGTIVWSTTAVFIRFLTVNYQMPALVLAFWREIGVALGLVIVIVLVKPRLLLVSRQLLPFFVLYGLILMIFNVTWTLSVALNGAAVSTVLVYSSPAITAIAAWRLWRERLDARKIVAVVLSMAGCVLVSGAYDSQIWHINPVGIVLGLVSGVLFAVYSIFGKEAARRDINPWVSLTYTFAFAPFFLLVLLLAPFEEWLRLDLGQFADLMWLGRSWEGWGVLLLLALGPTIGGYGLYSVSMRSLPASVANLIASTEPVFTTILAYLFLGERLLPVQILGSILILAGVILLRLQNGTASRVGFIGKKNHPPG